MRHSHKPLLLYSNGRQNKFCHMNHFRLSRQTNEEFGVNEWKRKKSKIRFCRRLLAGVVSTAHTTPTLTPSPPCPNICCTLIESSRLPHKKRRWEEYEELEDAEQLRPRQFFFFPAAAFVLLFSFLFLFYFFLRLQVSCY